MLTSSSLGLFHCRAYVCSLRAKEEIRDLLAKDQTKRLELKERPDTGVYVKVHLVCFLVIMSVHSLVCWLTGKIAVAIWAITDTLGSVFACISDAVAIPAVLSLLG